MQINVTVDEVDLTAPAGERYDREYGDRVPATLGEIVAEKLVEHLVRDDSYPTLRQVLVSIREQEIRTRINVEVERAFEQPLQKTNSYGEPIGGGTTLRDLIMDEVKKFLNTAIKRDSYDRNPAKTAAQAFVAEQVRDVLTKELSAALAEEKAKVVEVVRNEGARVLTAAVAKVVQAK